jgi:hypothetical protein
MALRSISSAELSTGKRIVLVGAIGGMLAGMMMAMVEMIYGWASDAYRELKKAGIDVEVERAPAFGEAREARADHQADRPAEGARCSPTETARGGVVRGPGGSPAL